VVLVACLLRAFRLQHNATIMQRLQELRTLVTSAFVQLAITERDQRLIALQERWDGLRQARAAFAAGDSTAAMRTGLVCRKLRTVGGAKNARVGYLDAVRPDKLSDSGEEDCRRPTVT
jgi:hypothetical protein